VVLLWRRESASSTASYSHHGVDRPTSGTSPRLDTQAAVTVTCARSSIASQRLTTAADSMGSTAHALDSLDTGLPPVPPRFPETITYKGKRPLLQAMGSFAWRAKPPTLMSQSLSSGLQNLQQCMQRKCAASEPTLCRRDLTLKRALFQLSQVRAHPTPYRLPQPPHVPHNRSGMPTSNTHGFRL
jgi:hypothetical protein